MKKIILESRYHEKDSYIPSRNSHNDNTTMNKIIKYKQGKHMENIEKIF